MLYIEKILHSFIELKTSDLHLSLGKIPAVRFHGKVFKLNSKEISDVAFIDYEIRPILNQDFDEFVEKYQQNKKQEYEELKYGRCFSIDSALSFEGRRFRLHFYMSKSGIVVVFRLLQNKIPTIEELLLPPEIAALTQFNKGLVLVTGATGSGKSTTLASLLGMINENYQKVIVTVEDPIEYVYDEKQCRIEQREVGIHVDSFGSATRDMLREDPDVILVGEMRDLETIKNAITLSETGHLVFGTLHTNSVVDSIDRIIDVFPDIQQQQVRIQLSNVLLAVVNQTLLNHENVMIPLCEIMVVNTVMSSLIRQGKLGNNLHDYIRTSKNGSVHIVDNIVWHISQGRLNIEECENIISETDKTILNNILDKENRLNSFGSRLRGVNLNGSRHF